MNGVRLTDVINRFNFQSNQNDWLLLDYKKCKVVVARGGSVTFGEHDDFDNSLHGRGIEIYPSGFIDIGYWDNGWRAPGKYIKIFSDGDVDVGEVNMNDGRMCTRGTRYLPDGRVNKFVDR